MARIITNNVPRDIIDAALLTAGERAGFGYLDWAAIDEGSDSASFFRYKGELHDLGTFTRLKQTPGWDEGHADSFFSALLVRYVNENEQVIVGLQLS